MKRQSKKNIDLKRSSSTPDDSNATNSSFKPECDNSSTNQSMEEREKEALETLINFGNHNENSNSANSNQSLDSTACHSEGQSSVSTVSKQTVADKILFLKTACEKSKTQTILQKRENLIQDEGNKNIKPESDDEIEIVHEVKAANPKPVSSTNIERL